MSVVIAGEQEYAGLHGGFGKEFLTGEIYEQKWICEFCEVLPNILPEVCTQPLVGSDETQVAFRLQDLQTAFEEQCTDVARRGIRPIEGNSL